ncbi:Permease of the drug/metabolite transporter (DMT) superfamily [Chelatococcus sambhunathii]|uniref:Permease of the drug/metabolite transporter (DMT) superfamily n=2 Tax=Chelatococcus sambhunathii TaxID=363953 RepID=A0ABP2A7H4_9HYPH|nr:Permease of the drug/metabolite transporter (DMT) superfamily [Chelatococcus sambhunathii]
MPFPPSMPAERLMPALFVVIWATGFVVARLVAPHAEPFTFLFIRYCLTIAVLGGLCLAVGAPWPRTARGWRDGLVAGVLLHGVYLGGVFWSVGHGLPAGIAALIAGMQPLLTGALAGPLIGERVSPRRWLGIITGFAGALLVLVPKLGGVDGLAPMAVLACSLGMVSITMGTFWQKRTGAGSDLRTNAVVQFIGAALVTLPAMLLAGDMRFDPAPPALAGLAWAVVVLSIGGILLLMHLIRRGAVAGVASLLYLVPPVSAVMAFLIFGESLAPLQMLGMAIAAVGVAIASRGA